MRDYHYRVRFKEGAFITVSAGCWSEAVILAAAERIKDAKHLQIVGVDMENAHHEWVPVEGKVVITMERNALATKDGTGEEPAPPEVKL